MLDKICDGLYKEPDSELFITFDEAGLPRNVFLSENAAREDLERLAVELGGQSWEPDFDNLEDGFECLLFHRGKWRHVKWNATHGQFGLGYAKGLIANHRGRAWAKLPPKPKNADGFFDWKD